MLIAFAPPSLLCCARLAEHLGGRVFFAGEATNRKHPATMAGAFLSGQAAAAALHAAMTRLQRGLPVVEELSEQARRAARAKAEADYAARLAERRAADGGGAAVLAQGRALEALFGGDAAQPPALEFGCFAAIHALPGSAHAGHSLLRVDLSPAPAAAAAAAANGSRNGSSGVAAPATGSASSTAADGPPPGPVYVCVRTSLVVALADTPSDDMRLAMLSALPEGRLTGRQGLSTVGAALLEELLVMQRQQ